MFLTYQAAPEEDQAYRAKNKDSVLDLSVKQETKVGLSFRLRQCEAYAENLILL